MAKDDDVHAANLVAFMRAQVIDEDRRSQFHLNEALQTINDSMSEVRKVAGIRKDMLPKK